MLNLLIESKRILSYLHSAISEEVSYSQSSDDDHEEDHEDEIEKKQTSFINKSWPLGLSGWLTYAYEAIEFKRPVGQQLIKRKPS